MEQRNWKDIKELFTELNKECNYLVMRNYENLLDDSFFVDGHEDIDFLCEDLSKMTHVLDVKSRKIYDNGVQYYILLQGQKIKIDIRQVGDNYYDEKWQRAMLSNKTTYADTFFTMNKEDYFYSLIYHSILQKKQLSKEYQSKLSNMKCDLFNIKNNQLFSEQELLDDLLSYMRKEEYYCVYPKDSTIPNRFVLVPGNISKKKTMWILRKIKHFPIRVVYYILNLVRRKKNG